MTTIALSCDIEYMINRNIIELKVESPEHMALIKQIRDFKRFHPFWTSPQKSKHRYYGKKLDDEVFAKQYWGCKLTYCNMTYKKINLIEDLLEDDEKKELRHYLQKDGILDSNGQLTHATFNDYD